MNEENKIDNLTNIILSDLRDIRKMNERILEILKEISERV
jgi:hypothetical protein